MILYSYVKLFSIFFLIVIFPQLFDTSGPLAHIYDHFHTNNKTCKKCSKNKAIILSQLRAFTVQKCQN